MTRPNDTKSPPGLCQCGCGQPTQIAKVALRGSGTVKGQPLRFIRGHHGPSKPRPEPPNPSGLCQCGCGGIATRAKMTNARLGLVKGEYVRFILGHQPPRPKIVKDVFGICECGCGGKTRPNVKGKPRKFIDGHRAVVIRCVICNAERRIIRANIGHIRTCGKKECASAWKSRCTTGRERKDHGPTITYVCACGCGQMFHRPAHRHPESIRHFVNPDHVAAYRLRRREAMGINTTSPTRYGPDWKRICHRIRARDKVCRQCGKTPEANRRALDVHHIRAFRVTADNGEGNLIAVCRSCHAKLTAEERPMLPALPLPVIERQPDIRNCVVCGGDFVARNARHMTCSKECRAVYASRKTSAYWREQAAKNTPVHQRKIERERKRVRHR